jgi:4-diphosphocytidyl-2-C-methyl-D-erythritol kinase
VSDSTDDPGGRLAPVVRLAPAKLNLTLAIVGRRDDGYHSLHSVMVPLGLADRLSVAPIASPDATDSLHVTGFDPGPPADNLVVRAIAAAREAAARPGLATPALAARLEKRIPVAAGLAGGSSDAAAAIDAALEAWGAEIDDDRRYRVASALGSDVPFFLAGQAALVEGRGERVTALHGVRGVSDEHPDPPGVLLVTPSVAAHTADVFAAWSNGAMAEPGIARRTSEHFASEFGSGLTVRALLERAAVLAAANDLLPAASAVVPGLVALRRALARRLHRPIGLSGSGPTLWALYPSRAEAEAAMEEVEAALGDGSLSAPGDGRPFVTATTIRTRGNQG